MEFSDYFLPVSVSREKVVQWGGETLSKVQNMGHEGRALAAITALSTSDEEMAFLRKHLAQLCNEAKGAYRRWFPWEDFRLLILKGGPCGTLKVVRFL